MKVLYVCDEYPPGRTGGIGIVVQNLARSLTSMGHEALVAGLYDHGYGGQSFENDHGVRVWRKRYGIPGPAFVQKIYRRLPKQLRSFLNGKKGVDQFMHFLQMLAEREKVDLIEVPDWHTFAIHCGCAVRWPALRVPLLLKSHGSYTYFSKEMGIIPDPLLHSNDQALFDRADALTAVSAYTARINERIFSLQRKMYVLYNGVHFHEITGNREPLKVIFTGALSEKKGIHKLIEAWNLVHEKIPEAHLHLFGKGKTAWLKALLNKSATESVHFYDHVKNERVMSELEKASVAVFPSYSETFGLMCVEAMAMGCAVIYTTRSCGPEIVSHEQNGLLADPDDIIGLASCICELLENHRLRDQLAKAGRESVWRRFSLDVIGQQHMEFYNRTIAEFRAH